MAWYGGKIPWPWWWAAPTYNQSDHAFRLCDQMTVGNIQAKKKESSPQAIWLTNGAMIEFRSWERPGGLYGPTVAGGVIDEFGQLTSEAYSALSSRRAETITCGFGHYRWFGNVGPVGGAAAKLWEKADEGNRGFQAFRWTWRDRAEAHGCQCDSGRPVPVQLGTSGQHAPTCQRGVYTAFIEDEAGRMSRSQFNRLYEAEWEDWNELPVYTFERATHVDPSIVLDPASPLHISCDFNVDPMAWIIGTAHGGEAWATDEIVIPGGATTQAACQEVIRRYPNPTWNVTIFGDASGRARKTSAVQTDYDIIRAVLGGYYPSFQMRVPKGNPPVQDRVNAYNAMLRTADGTVRYRMHPRCKKLANDLAKVAYKPGTRDFDKRDKSLTHFSDADGYRMVELFPVQLPGRVVVGVTVNSLDQPDEVMGAMF